MLRAKDLRDLTDSRVLARMPFKISTVMPFMKGSGRVERASNANLQSGSTRDVASCDLDRSFAVGGPFDHSIQWRDKRGARSTWLRVLSSYVEK